MYLCSCAIVVRNVKSLITNHKDAICKAYLTRYRTTLERISLSIRTGPRWRPWCSVSVTSKSKRSLASLCHLHAASLCKLNCKVIIN